MTSFGGGGGGGGAVSLRPQPRSLLSCKLFYFLTPVKTSNNGVNAYINIGVQYLNRMLSCMLFNQFLSG